MKINKVQRLAFFAILLTYSGYLFIESITNDFANWIINMTFCALLFYAALFVYVIWAVYYKHLDEKETKKMIKPLSIIFGLLSGLIFSRMYASELDLKYIFLLMPIIAIVIGAILTLVDKKLVRKPLSN